MTATRVLLLAAFIASVVPAQKLVDVHLAKKGERVRVMAPYQRGLAVARDGSLWVLFLTENEKTRWLSLVSSRDGGKTFDAPIEVPHKGAVHGAVVADVAAPKLHVTWSAKGEQKFLSVHYQAFDCTKRQWLGEPQRLLTGKNANNQFHSSDLEMTRQGHLALVAFTHRSPDRKVWSNGGWSSGLLFREKGGDTWSKPILINKGYSGINTNAIAGEGKLHFAYRSMGSSYGIHYRSLDLKQLTWQQPKDVAVAVTSREGTTHFQPTNTGCLGSDASGNLYVLYAHGPNTGRPKTAGELRMAFQKRGAKKWQVAKVTADPGQRGGNHNPMHFSLARGPGNQLFAIYSKSSEKHAKLYSRVFDHGTAVTKEKMIGMEQADAFTGVNGLRSSQADTTLFAAVSGATKQALHGRIAIVVLGLPVRSFWR